MPSSTPNINLRKINPNTDGSLVVNIDTDFNDNWDKIDAAVATKASVNSPTFTGTVGLPSSTSIGNVSSTELGYLDGVTSAIQTQLGILSTLTTTDKTSLTAAINENKTSISSKASTTYVDTAISAIPPVNSATGSTLGTVQVTTIPVSGNPIATSRVGSVSDSLLATTSLTTIATFTPTVNKSNYVIYTYFRVITGTTNVTVQITYTDGTGAQTNTLLNAQASTVGSYSLIPLFINATTAVINVKAQASVANQVYMSASVVGV
ncbi:hypothetical protein [Paenibacillus sp. Root444D2]|uniref:hypothetical protein n=1 Tax=Paenibacillus sp. Root444D2 TaxID=1736538 RepID=UPI00070FE22F|nr:hypothetical protein [Paenibacillus sp. Root444D2]KQX69220.1 hypothetical protein ASD40_01600 [Paenibacillus sp. Root444D2]